MLLFDITSLQFSRMVSHKHITYDEVAISVIVRKVHSLFAFLWPTFFLNKWKRRSFFWLLQVEYILFYFSSKFVVIVAVLHFLFMRSSFICVFFSFHICARRATPLKLVSKLSVHNKNKQRSNSQLSVFILHCYSELCWPCIDYWCNSNRVVMV